MGTNSPRSGAAASGAFWAAAIVLAVGATRVGSLEQEVIDWDESTFVLVAASVLDGRLPYVALFDIKPPMIFFLLAGAMAAFGESLVSVRLLGAACVAVSCVAVFAIARRRTDPVSAGLAALACVAVFSTRLGQPTYTELPAAAAFMAALWLCLARGDRLWAAAAAGALVSVAVLTRANLFPVAAAFAVWLAAAAPWGRASFRAAAVFALAGAVPPALTVLVYWRAGALAELWLAVVVAPLAFAEASSDPARALGVFAVRWFDTILWKPHLAGPFALAGAAGLWAAFRSARRGAPGERREAALLLLVCGAVAASVLIGDDAGHRHYWLQLFPILAVLGARALAWARARARWRPFAHVLVAACLAEAAWKTGPPAARLALDPAGAFDGHFVRRAARAIAEDRRPGDAVWALTHHLVYWYLDTDPPSKLVHPSNWAKPETVAPLAAAGYIDRNLLRGTLASRPAYLVTDAANPVPWYLEGEDAARLRGAIAADYAPFHDEGGVRVYRRRRGETGASTPPPPAG